MNSFKLAYKKRIGGDHMESQDWRKDEVDVLLELTMVSERSKWDQQDPLYQYLLM